jgi:putative transposase
LRRAIGEAHRRSTRHVHFREGWRGHLWQGRFASFVMDEPYLLAAARYVELNPVRARLAARQEDFRWSCASAHLFGKDDVLVETVPLLQPIPDWREFLDGGMKDNEIKAMRRHERSGRPLGNEGFLSRLEKRVGRVLRRLKPGPKPRARIK